MEGRGGRECNGGQRRTQLAKELWFPRMASAPDTLLPLPAQVHMGGISATVVNDWYRPHTPVAEIRLDGVLAAVRVGALQDSLPLPPATTQNSPWFFSSSSAAPPVGVAQQQHQRRRRR